MALTQQSTKHTGWLAREWRRASIVQRLVLVALIPTAITALMLVLLLTRHQSNALREMARISAGSIAQQAAAVASEPLRQGDRRALASIARSINNLPHVVHVQIAGADGEILAHAESVIEADSAPTMTVIREVSDRGAPGQHIGSVLVDVSLAQAVAAQRLSLFTALLWLCASLLAAALVSWQQARWISKPLRRLAVAVHQLGQGDREVAVAITDDTEIGELQRGFNAAAATLLDTHRDMQRLIEEATLELERKNSALEAASVAKARFLAGATHDLRQPLYALTLFSSTLALNEHDPQQLDRIAHVQECVESLDHLFAELLDLSRLETGAVPVHINDMSLDDVFEEVSRNFRMIAEQRDLRLILRKTNLWIRSDRTVIARMLNNLVSNALRYTRNGGVLVAARRRGHQVRIDVWDTGKGIAEEHLGKVFEEFFRVDPGHEQSHPGNAQTSRGLGLGLSTVQKLAALLDCQVTLRSQLGRGSMFSLTVPLARRPMESVAMKRQPALPANLAGKRVIVIDDEQAILAAIGPLLRSWGCEVRLAEDREQALHHAEDWRDPPDIVISDLHLRQGGSGLEVLNTLHMFYCDDRNAPSPFARLLITGETRSEQLHAIKAARIAVLHKPVTPEQLREAIAAACANPDNIA